METVINGNICIITPIRKQIDTNNAKEFGQQLFKNLEKEFNFILDLKNITFMDSSGLGIVITGLRKVNEKNKIIVLCNANNAVMILFNMVRLSQIATICDTIDDSINYIKDH